MSRIVRGQGERREESVAVAIDKDKGSEHAIKWAVDHLLARGRPLTLLHVDQTSSPEGSDPQQTQGLFLSFRSFCSKKNIKCNEVVIKDNDIPNAIIDYVMVNTIEILVLGTPSKSGIFRFKLTDVPSTVSKRAPDFCSVYVIGRGKVSYMRYATSTPQNFAQPGQVQHQPSSVSEARSSGLFPPHDNHISPSMDKSYELSPETDISFVSIGRPSIDRMSPRCDFGVESGINSRLSIGSDGDNRSPTSSYSRHKFLDMGSLQCEMSSCSVDSGKSSSSSQNMDDVEAEMRRLKLELKQTMEMYSTACKEALIAKHKEKEINQWKMEDEQRLEVARHAEEVALALVEKEKAKCKAAIEAAEAAQRIAELEAQKRRVAEMKAFKESEEKKALQARSYDLRYRKYTIQEIEKATNDFSQDRKIGEGGYGPVYRGELDHTTVAIKILRPDAAQGQSQFKQEVEVLSCIRHPNMVLLLGACPDYGCLVYEYMGNGSLEDRLFRTGNTPVIPWQIRFRIAAEIGTGLLFLHQTKPEPLVHRDLKPGNILLDHNYVSKISDVGLARLVPPSVANAVTQYHMTSTAGTFCYIDPEYQQTGLLGTKSDIYSLGVMFLQIITAKPPMGLTHHIERAIETGTFAEMLDPAVPDWPVEEALKFAKLCLQCAEMRRKDRPDLGKVVLPELNRLRALADESLNCVMACATGVFSPRQRSNPLIQDVISQPSGSESSRSRSSTSSFPGKMEFSS
ncbi:U-box domain-containing protein 52-like [Pyrus x bretschneideri]|uniref:U-box domain-containing protein 52-like n=1 Tax=Pyrus x bretschneideri TaxID=225117 RepID=UPI0020304B0B|nr:U-box domain-containing protein 52-like [Pyrus x bretschneideri]